MYNQNIFETAARIIPLLQAAEWEKEEPKMGDLYHLAKPVDITSLCSSRDEAALAAQVLTRILYESSHFEKDMFLILQLSREGKGGAKGTFLLDGSLPQESDIERFKADDSLKRFANRWRGSDKPPANLKEAIRHVRDVAAKEWTQDAQGDYHHTLPLSHGNSGEKLLFNEVNARQINDMLEARPDDKRLPGGERPRLVFHRENSNSPTVLTVRKQDARKILVDLLGLDAKKLGIPSTRTPG
jgi:hypothetical protein